jgi:hypothetical protein
MEPVEVEESFNLVRQRLNQAITGTNRDGVKADDKERNRPLHKLSFKTTEGGRISVAPEHLIGVGSDSDRDGGDEEE